jgi:hypothetical protein
MALTTFNPGHCWAVSPAARRSAGPAFAQTPNELGSGRLSRRDKHVLDLRAIIAGMLAGSALTLLLGWAGIRSDRNLGATGGALSDGIYIFLATMAGVFLAGALGAALSRGVALVLDGTLATVAAFVLIIAPVVIFVWEAPDVPVASKVWDAVAVFLIMLPVGVVGAVVGWLARSAGRDRSEETMTEL